MTLEAREELLLAKIRALPPDKVAEVDDFIDFIRRRVDDEALKRAARQLSEAPFRKVWDNPEDAVYDEF
jgi:hypothetical protein